MPLKKKGLINFYDIIPEDLKRKTHNPHYKKHGIKLPMRVLIAGGSGSMKTSTLLNLLHKMPNTFSYIIVCCKSKDEQLYNYLELKAQGSIQFFENATIPSMSEVQTIAEENDLNLTNNKSTQDNMLIVFDDLINDTKIQPKIADFFIRSRKFNISCVYISQSYFKTPKMIRLNCNYIMLKKLPNKNDLKMILREYDLGIDIDQLIKYYNDATKDRLSFLLIDLEETEPEKKFRNAFEYF